MTLICAPMCFTSWYNGKMLLWCGAILGCIWVIGHVPALLYFTVNHQKKGPSINDISSVGSRVVNGIQFIVKSNISVDVMAS